MRLRFLTVLAMLACTAGMVWLGLWYASRLRVDRRPPSVSLSVNVDGKTLNRDQIATASVGQKVVPIVSVQDDRDPSPVVQLHIDQLVHVRLGGEQTEQSQVLAPNTPHVFQSVGTYSITAHAVDTAGNKSMDLLEIHVLKDAFLETAAVIEEIGVGEGDRGMTSIEAVVLLGSTQDIEALSLPHLVLQLLDSQGAMMGKPITHTTAIKLPEGPWRIKFSHEFEEPLALKPTKLRIAGFAEFDGLPRKQFFADTGGIQPEPDAVKALQSVLKPR